jgi:hypothetical protein
VALTATVALFGQGEFRKVENNAFDVGEKLTYSVKYGFVTAGQAVIEIPRIKRVAGRDAYNIKLQINSLPSFDFIYTVRTWYESYLDVEAIIPWRFEQHIRETNFSNDYSAFFDQRSHKAKTTEGTYDIPPNTQDIISAYYYTRTMDFSNKKKGDRITLVNFYDGKLHDLDVVYLGKERVTVEAGTFDCVVVEPLVLEGGFFKSEGDIVLWMTDDELKIPVLVNAKVPVGSLDVELKQYEGLAGELKARVK